MATDSRPSSSSHEDRKQSLTCSLCMDIFTEPKILPCSHTFCLKCLEDLVTSLSTSTTSTFPCPYCRFEVTVPAGEGGGASALRSNVYIRPEDLDVAREGTRCLTHPDQKLDLYCTHCQLPVCLKCVLVEHKLHTTLNLCDAAKEARLELGRIDDMLLQTAVSSMDRAVEVDQGERRDLRDKKAALQTLISSRHSAVVALADKRRDELLASLDAVCGSAEEDVDATLATKTGHQQDLRQLRKRLQEALTAGTACSLVAVAKEMREGKGIAQVVENMTSGKRSTITRPVLNCIVMRDAVVQHIEGFFGTVDTVEMCLSPAQVVVQEKFTCRQQETDTEVFSLCPLDDGNVLVSYVNCGLENNTTSDSFDENGNLQISFQKATGKCSFKSRGKGEHLLLESSVSSGININSKNKDHDNYHLKLCHSLQGKSSIKKTKVTSEDTLDTEDVTEFTINVAGPHRAFDVDSGEQFFAVVEEPPAPDIHHHHQRQVKLYHRNRADAIATYSPPSTPFNPSDVCFCSLGGEEEVLTVADEAGDSIHVVRFALAVQPSWGTKMVLKRRAGTTSALTFVRHLAPGCPTLVQPTALNTDPRGRLWVACRGGAILALSSVSRLPGVSEASDC